MSRLHYITGAAGTGKTHALADRLVEWFEDNALSEHQSVLALTRMHGARKRLHERLASKSIPARICVSTVDSFALQLANRWRLSLGYSSPIVIGDEGHFVKDELGYRATFEEIMASAASLSASPIVCKTVASSFPLVLVDEFQDCTGDQLSLIRNLREHADLVLAADPFQSLNADESACDWAASCEGQPSVKVTRLNGCRRTGCAHLLEAADALRENRPATYCGSPLPFYFAPRYAMAVWKVLPHLAPNSTAALIYHAHDSLNALATSAQSQDKKRLAEGKQAIVFPWRTQVSDAELTAELSSDLAAATEQGTWGTNATWRRLHEQAQHLSKVKGLSQPSDELLKYVVTSFVHSKKFVLSRPIRREATTVHGAKNREFDHVYVLWDSYRCSNLGVEQKRRLLYNAITRARQSCTLIAMGSQKQIRECPVLSLLGDPKACFGS